MRASVNIGGVVDPLVLEDMLRVVTNEDQQLARYPGKLPVDVDPPLPDSRG